MIELLIPCVILLIMICGGIWCKNSENKEWNNGICSECENGFYKSFDMDSSGSVGFSCTNCGNTIWQSYNRR